MKWYYDERGWYVSEKELKADYKNLKEKGETGCSTFKSYIADCIGSNGTLRKCENMFCRNCIDAVRSRGERLWVSDEIVEEDDMGNRAVCDWCEEEDEVMEVRFD